MTFNRRIVEVVKLEEFVAGYFVTLECGHHALVFGDLPSVGRAPCALCYEALREARHNDN